MESKTENGIESYVVALTCDEFESMVSLENLNNNNVRIAQKYRATASEDGTTVDLKTMQNWEKILITMCVFISTLMTGSCSGTMGPTLVHVTLLYGTDTTSMSIVFIYLNTAYFLGALSSGIFFDRFNANLQNTVVCLCMGLSLASAPWMTSIYFYQALIAMQAFCQGYLYAAVPGQIFNLWSESKFKGPLLQSANALWSVGCFLTPFLTVPFLVELTTECRHMTTLSSPENSQPAIASHGFTLNDTLNNNNSNYSSTIFSAPYSSETLSAPQVCDVDVSSVRHVFSVVGLGTAVAGFLCLVPFILRGPSLRTKEKKPSPIEKVDPTTPPERKLFKWTLLIILCVFFTFYICVIYLPQTFLTSFVIQGLGWAVEKGPVLTSVFTGVAGLGRIICIPLAYYVKPGPMLTTLLVLSTASYMGLAFAPYYSDILTWICVATAGLGVSSMHSFCILWLGQYVTVNGTIGAVFLMSASIGGLTGSALIGRLFPISHMWLIYVCLVSCIVDIILFIILNVIVKCCYVKNDVKTMEIESLRYSRTVMTSHKGLHLLKNENIELYASKSSLY